MCLSKLYFNLDYNAEEDDYVGKGFKLIYYYNNPKYKHIPPVGIYDFPYKFNEWMNRWRIPPQLPLEKNFDAKYNNGFHIFLNQNDAENYRPRLNVRDNIGEYKLHPVLFKGILNFGEQELFNKKIPFVDAYRTGPCIIADKMKILDPIPFSWEKKVGN